MTTRDLDAADRAMIDRARDLAAATTAEEMRAWYASHGDERGAALQWPALQSSVIGTAQSLLSEVARIAERPDEAGTLDYAAAKVAEVRDITRRALCEEPDTAASHAAALRSISEELAKLADLLPEPIGAGADQPRPCPEPGRYLTGNLPLAGNPYPLTGGNRT